MTDKLTPKRRRFVEEYLIDLNGAGAYVRAGYTAKNGNVAAVEASRLLSNPNIEVAIEEATAARSERTGITQDYVLSTIRETIARCSQAEPVLDRKGEPVYVETPSGDDMPAYTFDSGAVLRGCELLGRHLKMFTDRVEADINTTNHEQALADLE